MTSKDSVFHSSFSQKELSGYDWSNVGSRSMRGSLKDLYRKLSQRIEEHNANDNFTSHSNLYDLIQNLFACYLLWDTTASNNFPINRLFDSLSVEISSKCQSLILNVLSLHWQQIKRYKNSNKAQYESLRVKYECLVHDLRPLMDAILLKTKLNPEACHSLKLFTKLKLPKTKDIDPISTLDRRRKTRMYYVQNKFNLLIEESEGFAKLMTEIAEHLQQTHYKQSIYNKQHHDDDDEDDDVDMNQKEAQRDDDSSMLETKIFELIGQFKLDPNRVIDIILHGLEYDVNNDVLLKLLKNNFISDNIVTILGFQFRFFQSKKGNKPTPKSLYLLTLHLIHYEIITLHQILPHLSVLDLNPPKDKTNKTVSTLIDAHKQERKQFERNEKERARLINYVNLNDSIEEKEMRQKTELELYRKREEYHVSNKSSQIFELLLHMINYGDWKHCAQLLAILDEVHCESKHFINCALMELLQDIISPLYDKYCAVWSVLSPASLSDNKTSFTPLDDSLILGTNDEDLLRLPAIIEPIISALNVYLYRGPILYGKICRILCVIMRHTNVKDVDSNIEDIMQSLLASYSLIENNSGLSYDLWRLLSQFNFSDRFKFYGYWKDVVYTAYPELWCHREDAIKDTKYLLRRYHVDDSNQKKLGRMFARYIDCHPVLVFDLVLAQLQAYSANVTTVVDGFRYLTHLDRDVLIWCVLVECESKSPKIRRDTYYSDWFRALCDIMSQFYVSTATAQSGSACAECDVLPILLYVLNKLLVGYCDHLLMFKKIIQKLTQIEAFGEVITYAQLSCLGGSQLLKQVVLQLDNAKLSRKSKIIKKFSRTLASNGLIISIFVLLNHVSLNLSYNYNPNEIDSFRYFDLMPTQMDITNDMFVQLFLFMKHHILSNSKYRDMLYQNKYAPTLSQLYEDHKVKVSYCFMLCRLFRAHEKKDKEKSKENAIVQKMFDVTEIQDIFSSISPNIWTCISPTAYSLFWSIEISDIFVPNAEYDQQIKRQSDAARQHARDLKMMTSRQHIRVLRDEDYSKLRKLKKDMKNAEEISRDLAKHKEEQNRTVAANIAVIKKMSKKIVIECHKTFLFECVVPRLNTSDIDAKYAAKFIELMVNSSIRQFYLMDFTKVFLLNFNQILSSSTYSESRRLGRFLADFMLILEKYRENKPAFNEFTKLEAAKYTHSAENDQGSVVSIMSYDDFCTEFRSMHRSLTIYLVHLMQSNNLLWQKNSILVLNEVRSVFPRVLSHAKHLKAKVSLIKSNTVKGTSMAVLCERVIAILEKGIDSDSYLDEQKFGGRNLGNKNNVVPKAGVSAENNEHTINELRRKALESQIKKKNEMSSKSPKSPNKTATNHTSNKSVKMVTKSSKSSPIKTMTKSKSTPVKTATKSKSSTNKTVPNSPKNAPNTNHTNHVIGQKRRFSQIAPNGTASKPNSNETNKRSRITSTENNKDSNNDPKEDRDRPRLKMHRSSSHEERERSNRKYRESTRDRKSSDNRDRERDRERDKERSRTRDGNNNSNSSNNESNSNKSSNVEKRNGTRSGKESRQESSSSNRGNGRERERGRDRDRERERSRDKDRDRERERDRDRIKEREKEKSRDGYRDKNGAASSSSSSSASYSYSSSNPKSKVSNTASINEYKTKESANYDKKDRDRSHRDNKRSSRHRR